MGYIFRTGIIAIVLSTSLAMVDNDRGAGVADEVQGCKAPPPPCERPEVSMVADFVVLATPSLQWDVNSAVNPTLTLTRGETYTIDLTAITDEHPWVINSNATNPWGTLFMPSTYGQVVSFTPNFTMPGTIYYHCDVHYSGMAGTIILQQPTCPADIDDSGTVGIGDFLALNSAYGTTCGLCPADVDHNGVVGISDFLALNSAYGTACN